MNHVRRLFRSIGLLSMAALSLMAISATSAQASGNWRIEGVNLVGERALMAEKDQMFEFLVEKLSLEILCNKFELLEGKLLEGGKSLGKLVFKECETFSMTASLKRIPVCDPVGGEIKLLALGLLILHMNKTYNLLSPDLGENFGSISYGEECFLEKASITGSFVLEDCSLADKFETKAVRHLVQQAPAGLFPKNTLLYGASELILDGSVRLQLANSVEMWSGLT